MKRIFPSIIFLFLFISSGFAQLAKESWRVGAGVQYPRFIYNNITPTNTNYSGFVSFQRYFTENIALRLKAAYLHIEGKYDDLFLIKQTGKTDAVTGDLDFIYNFILSKSVSPYLSVGAGVNYIMLTNKATPSIEDKKLGVQINGGLGVEFSIRYNWKFITEGGYHLTLNSNLDGALGIGEIHGKDSYITITVGVLFIF